MPMWLVLSKHQGQFISDGLRWAEIPCVGGCILLPGGECAVCEPSEKRRAREACTWVPPDSTRVFFPVISCGALPCCWYDSDLWAQLYAESHCAPPVNHRLCGWPGSLSDTWCSVSAACGLCSQCQATSRGPCRPVWVCSASATQALVWDLGGLLN